MQEKIGGWLVRSVRPPIAVGRAVMTFAVKRAFAMCAAPRSLQDRRRGEHKQVTVLFADVVGSMKLAAALDVGATPRDHERAVQPRGRGRAALSGNP